MHAIDTYLERLKLGHVNGPLVSNTWKQYSKLGLVGEKDRMRLTSSSPGVSFQRPFSASSLEVLKIEIGEKYKL